MRSNKRKRDELDETSDQPKKKKSDNTLDVEYSTYGLDNALKTICFLSTIHPFFPAVITELCWEYMLDSNIIAQNNTFLKVLAQPNWIQSAQDIVGSGEMVKETMNKFINPWSAKVTSDHCKKVTQYLKDYSQQSEAPLSKNEKIDVDYVLLDKEMDDNVRYRRHFHESKVMLNELQSPNWLSNEEIQLIKLLFTPKGLFFFLHKEESYESIKLCLQRLCFAALPPILTKIVKGFEEMMFLSVALGGKVLSDYLFGFLQSLIATMRATDRIDPSYRASRFFSQVHLQKNNHFSFDNLVPFCLESPSFFMDLISKIYRPGYFKHTNSHKSRLLWTELAHSPLTAQLFFEYAEKTQEHEYLGSLLARMYHNHSYFIENDSFPHHTLRLVGAKILSCMLPYATRKEHKDLFKFIVDQIASGKDYLYWQPADISQINDKFYQINAGRKSRFRQQRNELHTELKKIFEERIKTPFEKETNSRFEEKSNIPSQPSEASFHPTPIKRWTPITAFMPDDMLSAMTKGKKETNSRFEEKSNIPSQPSEASFHPAPIKQWTPITAFIPDDMFSAITKGKMEEKKSMALANPLSGKKPRAKKVKTLPPPASLVTATLPPVSFVPPPPAKEPARPPIRLQELPVYPKTFLFSKEKGGISMKLEEIKAIENQLAELEKSDFAPPFRIPAHLKPTGPWDSVPAEKVKAHQVYGWKTKLDTAKKELEQMRNCSGVTGTSQPAEKEKQTGSYYPSTSLRW